MRRSLSLLVVPALLVTGCGGDDGEPAATSSSSPASTSATPSGSTSAGASTDAASVGFEDQSGDGASAVVDRVVIPQDGFVVVSVHDGAVLGSVAVTAGSAETVQVPLQPPITRDTELDATLYLDSDGNGAFDAAVDLPVAAPDQSRDRDRTDDHDGDPDQDQDRDRDQDLSHDVVSDDAHYRVA